MGTEYGLYHKKTKTYIWLGKMNHTRQDFQIDAEKIAKFLFQHGTEGDFEIIADTGNMPEEKEEGWVKMANWCEEEDD